MHTFDVPSRSPHPRRVPAMRPPYEAATRSATPIYDALYAEYRRMFRALPGDRTGEDELGFTAFDLYDASEPPGPGRHRVARPALPPGDAPYGEGMHDR